MIERNVDILVVGAGQAGLAIGYHLQQAGYRFQLVDRNVRVGDSWRNRYDSLVLFTPRAYSALPGLPVPGDPDGYPTKDEIADYLEQYAAHFDLPVAMGTGIRSLTRRDGGFRAMTDTDVIVDTRAVVLATGAFQRPAIPAIGRQFASDVLQLTGESYKNPGQVPPGRVLVVGDGATGRQLAVELMATHNVVLATGRPRRASPERILGKSIFWWMDRLGILGATRESPIGRYLIATDPFPGKALDLTRLRQRGIQVVGRLVQVEGKHVSFASGETAGIDAVIWATGYRDDSTWLPIPGVADVDGRFVHQRGVSPLPGLFFIGRSWQWRRGSALLHGVGDDAAYVVGRITEQLGAQPARSPREPQRIGV
jgi:putative flavoprotein involved in K+ transport